MLNLIDDHLLYVRKHNVRVHVNMSMNKGALSWQVVPMDGASLTLIDENGEPCGKFNFDSMLITYYCMDNNIQDQCEIVEFEFFQDTEESAGLNTVDITKRLITSFTADWNDPELADHNKLQLKYFLGDRIVYLF